MTKVRVPHNSKVIITALKNEVGNYFEPQIGGMIASRIQTEFDGFKRAMSVLQRSGVITREQVAACLPKKGE